MVNDKIGNTVFSIIFEICKKHNRANVDSIHKHMKTVNLENITKEFLDDRILTRNIYYL